MGGIEPPSISSSSGAFVAMGLSSRLATNVESNSPPLFRSWLVHHSESSLHIAIDTTTAITKNTNCTKPRNQIPTPNTNKFCQNPVGDKTHLQNKKNHSGMPPRPKISNCPKILMTKLMGTIITHGKGFVKGKSGST